MIPKKSESSDDEEEDVVGDANDDVTHDDVTDGNSKFEEQQVSEDDDAEAQESDDVITQLPSDVSEAEMEERSRWRQQRGPFMTKAAKLKKLKTSSTGFTMFWKHCYKFLSLYSFLCFFFQTNYPTNLPTQQHRLMETK